MSAGALTGKHRQGFWNKLSSLNPAFWLESLSNNLTWIVSKIIFRTRFVKSVF